MNYHRNEFTDETDGYQKDFCVSCVRHILILIDNPTWIAYDPQLHNLRVERTFPLGDIVKPSTDEEIKF